MFTSEPPREDNSGSRKIHPLEIDTSSSCSSSEGPPSDFLVSPTHSPPLSQIYTGMEDSNTWGHKKGEKKIMKPTQEGILPYYEGVKCYLKKCHHLQQRHDQFVCELSDLIFFYC